MSDLHLSDPISISECIIAGDLCLERNFSAITNQLSNCICLKGNNDPFHQFERIVIHRAQKDIHILHGHQFEWFSVFSQMFNFLKSSKHIYKPGKISQQYINQCKKYAKDNNCILICGHKHYEYHCKNVFIMQGGYRQYKLSEVLSKVE